MTSYNKNDPATIKSLFDSIATQYDRTNAVLSFRMHNRWNRTLINQAIIPTRPKALLDLCCGTGAITFAYLAHVHTPIKAYLLDFSKGMLEHARYKAGKKKLSAHEITYLQADAQAIPIADNCIDCVTIAYGIRNVKKPQVCFDEAYRVLAPGGTFGILELTQPQHPILRFGHKVYLRAVLPLIGKLLTSNREAYQYLCNSIHTFIPPSELERLMCAAGFNEICRLSLSGGIATILIGKKPRA